MVVALSLLLLLVYKPTGAVESLAVRQPLVPSTRSRGAYQKSSIPVTQNVHKIDILSRDVSVSSRMDVARRGLTDIENIAYTKASYNVLLHVGDILFEVALDTGSSDLWLISDECKTTQCQNTPAYPLTSYASPTFVTVNSNQTIFNLSFADSTSVSGFVARETVRIGSLATVGQALALVTSSNVTLGKSVSGLWGLGFSRLSQIAASTSSAPPFLSALAELGDLDYPMFGLSLTRNSSGTLSMGAIDKSIVSNSSMVSWHEVVPFPSFLNENVTAPPYLHWAIPLNNITANGTAIPLHPTYPTITGPAPLALLDIGSNGIYGPVQDVAAIFFALGTIRQASEGAWVLPCGIQSTMTFSFAGTNVTLQPSDYLIGPTQADPALCFSWPMALPPRSDGLDWQFGTPFLRTVYSVFSYGISGREPPLIGIYPLSNTTALTTTPSSLHSLFSSLSATIATTVPPVLLPTSTFSTPPYTFNTAATPLPTLGEISFAASELGAETYSALFTPAVGGTSGLVVLENATALPVIDAPTTLATIVSTDASGSVHTTTSTASVVPTALLGKPTTFSVNDAGAARLKGGEFRWGVLIAVVTLLVEWGIR